jgi:hypothetical protein
LYGLKAEKIFNAEFAYNLLEEIDNPGEYYIDRTSGFIFLSAEKELKTIEVSMLEEPLVQLKILRSFISME